MPVAVVQEWTGGERGTDNYDAISERLRAGDPVQAMRVHTAGWDGETFRIFEVWDTAEDHQRFVDERLMPILHEVVRGDATPPTTSTYELHGFVAAQGDPTPAG